METFLAQRLSGKTFAPAQIRTPADALRSLAINYNCGISDGEK
jgi:hypothetical protein